MDQQAIQQIAAEVAKHLLTISWIPLLLQVVLTVAAAAAGAFYGEYFRTRGKNLATKADFEMLKEQLRANTQLVEAIKSDVSQRDWAKREWTNLRRGKLEELIQQVHKTTFIREMAMSRAILTDETIEPKEVVKELLEAEEQIERLDTLAELYLPEIITESQAYSKAHRELFNSCQTRWHGRSEMPDPEIDKAEYEKFSMEVLNPQVLVADLAKNALNAAARKLLLQIMEVAH